MSCAGKIAGAAMLAMMAQAGAAHGQVTVNLAKAGGMTACTFLTDAAGVNQDIATQKVTMRGVFTTECQGAAGLPKMPLTGPATGRVFQDVILRWQMPNVVNCKTGDSGSPSTFPGTVVGWPTSTAGVVLCYDCGNSAPQQVAVMPTQPGTHTFMMQCQIGGADPNRLRLETWHTVVVTN